jgi:hypothetical protein
MGWIEINLPWDVHSDWDLAPKMPNLSEKEKEVFGISHDSLTDSVQEDLAQCRVLLDEMRALQDAAENLAIKSGQVYSDYICSDEYNQIEVCFWAKHANDPCMIAKDKFHSFREKMDSWYEEQPEIKEYHLLMKEFQKEEKYKSFSGRGLNQPGTLIELEDDTIHFIGTINELGGSCNDCTAFDSDTIIKRYSKVFDFKESN